jgi:hypothetical protein
MSIGIDQGRPSTPGPARASITPNGSAQVRLVSTAELTRGDMDTSGDLVESGRFLIFGWKTNDSEEEGTRVEASTPAEAGRTLTSLLRSGHVHFTASRLTPDGRVAYPS